MANENVLSINLFQAIESYDVNSSNADNDVANSPAFGELVNQHLTASEGKKTPLKVVNSQDSGKNQPDVTELTKTPELKSSIKTESSAVENDAEVLADTAITDLAKQTLDEQQPSEEVIALLNFISKSSIILTEKTDVKAELTTDQNLETSELANKQIAIQALTNLELKSAQVTEAETENSKANQALQQVDNVANNLANTTLTAEQKQAVNQQTDVNDVLKTEQTAKGNSSLTSDSFKLDLNAVINRENLSKVSTLSATSSEFTVEESLVAKAVTKELAGDKSYQQYLNEVTNSSGVKSFSIPINNIHIDEAITVDPNVENFVLDEELSALTDQQPELVSRLLSAKQIESGAEIDQVADDVNIAPRQIAEQLTQLLKKDVDVHTNQIHSTVQQHLNAKTNENTAQNASLATSQMYQAATVATDAKVANELEFKAGLADNEAQIQPVNMPKVEQTTEGKVAVNTTPIISTTTTTTNVVNQTNEAIAQHQSIQAGQSGLDSLQTKPQASVMHNETIAIHRRDFANVLQEKVMVMINRRLQQFEIRLDPPELGSLHIKVSMQNEQAIVNFVVQNQQAKEALEQNIVKLRDMMAEQGINVADANVKQQQQNQSGEKQGSSNHGDVQDEWAQDSDTQAIEANVVKGSTTGVDYYV